MSTSADEHILTTLGVGLDEEQVYRMLLARPGSSTAELLARTTIGRRRLRLALGELESKAMITRRRGTPSRFHPAPPDIVVEALISAREHELNQARLGVPELTRLLQRPAEQLRGADLVEVIATREAATERWLQLQRVTKERLEVFVRPPYGQQRLDDNEAVQRSLLARGVVSVGIYDKDALRHPEMLEHIRQMTALGEQARVVSRVPLKLGLFDRRVALVPLTQPDPNSTVDAGLVVHESALLDALITLFDVYYQRSMDVSIVQQPPSTRQTGVVDGEAVLTLLAGGLKDEAIARQLGVSTNTVRRRIATVLDDLGVTTRFQAGLALGSRDWSGATLGMDSHHLPPTESPDAQAG